MWKPAAIGFIALAILPGAGGVMAASAVPLQLDAALAGTRARAAVDYLLSIETAEGRFLYEFDFLAGRFNGADNIVRQTGVGLVLNQYLFRHGDDWLREPAARTIGYYETKSVPHGSGRLVSEDGKVGGARAGATALALLAELFHFRTTGDDSHREARMAWLRGLQELQLPEGGFQRNPGTGEEESYSNGEAWLALAGYADAFPSDMEARAMLARAEPHFMSHYLERPDAHFAHWGLMAAAQRYASTKDVRYLDFLDSFSAIDLDRFASEVPAEANSCAMMEGLVAAADTLAKAGRNPDLVAALKAEIDLQLGRSLALQVQPGQARVVFGPDRSYEDPKLANFAGGFLDSGISLTLRIDMTQHCLSALMQYEQMKGQPGD